MQPAELVTSIDAAWRALRSAVVLGDLDRTTSAGWTVKEMLGHVAFWMEAPYGVVYGMIRGEPLPDGFAFRSGFVPGDEWPSFEVHNAREASWARGQTSAAVLRGADTAHADLLTLLRSVTDDEATAHADYFAEVEAHFHEHLAELDR